VIEKQKILKDHSNVLPDIFLVYIRRCDFQVVQPDLTAIWLSKQINASRIMSFYSTIMRGIPPIVLLFILYFIMSGSINLSPFWAGSISLGIISSAYQMEIIRGAILSVSGGQMIAALAIGMSRIEAIRYIILPQTLRLAIPPWSNEAAIVIKDSSLVYALGVPEILRRAQLISASTQQPFLAYTTAALIYFGLVLLTNTLLGRLEKRLRIPANP